MLKFKIHAPTQLDFISNLCVLHLMFRSKNKIVAKLTILFLEKIR
ncbi:hypothetical protein [Metamycoplasma hominis]|nr:hypothetical protein [Metamycoplasma hominis]